MYEVKRFAELSMIFFSGKWRVESGKKLIKKTV